MIMEKILQRLGRFLGEKFALIDEVYLKKGEIPAEYDKDISTVNGYVDMLPPRPVKGDKYIIRPGNKKLYTGIYNLNFGFNNKKYKSFHIVGDNKAHASGQGRWANTTGAGVETGMIPFEGDLLKIYVGVSGGKKHDNLNITVEEYNGSDQMVKSSILVISKLEPENFVPDVHATKIKIRITGTVPIAYIKVWEGKSSRFAEQDKVYFFNGQSWEIRKVTEGAIIGVKGKSYLLNRNIQGFQIREIYNIPKIEIKEGTLSVGLSKNIPLKEPVRNNDYVIRYFCRRRRWCTLANGKRVHKNKYFECTHPRVFVDSFSTSHWLQRPPSLFSKFTVPVENGELIKEIPIKFIEFICLVFTPVTNISGLWDFPWINKFYPSNGFIGKREKAEEEGSYADFAICLSKKLNGKWKNGEMCYFRIIGLKKVRMNSKVSVRLLKR